MTTSKLFIGREYELKLLKSMHETKDSSLIVVKGRRRIGKSYLINYFASLYPKNKIWNFEGLATNTGITSKDQLDNFGYQLAKHIKLPPFTFNDWSQAFEHLSSLAKPGDIVLLDEISWMGSKDPSFIPKFKIWWDNNSLPITLFICGSVSPWIEENIINSTALFGRINLSLTLEPLSIKDSYNLLLSEGFKGSDFEVYIIMCIMGGIPWYLKQIKKGNNIFDTIKILCFNKNGLLFNEFDSIFYDLFNGRGSFYKKILSCLKEGAKTLSEIREIISYPQGGGLSILMEHLITGGFVAKFTQWSFKTNNPLKQSVFKISDPYMRFYLKLIEPNLDKINQGGFQNTSISSIPGFESHIGLQIEQILIQNRNTLNNSIGINQIDIINCGPYRQSKTNTRRGCQIDYLIQTKTKSLYVCEFKFTSKELSIGIISEMQDKISKLKIPRGYSVVPVLFHISGVSDKVSMSDYFYRIIDISDFLRKDYN